MGWICLAVFGQLWDTLPRAAFLWLLAGGLIYTVGGIIYALKLPIFNNKHKYFGSHEIFHLFVMGGSICHFIFMWHSFKWNIREELYFKAALTELKMLQDQAVCLALKHFL